MAAKKIAQRTGSRAAGKMFKKGAKSATTAYALRRRKNENKEEDPNDTKGQEGPLAQDKQMEGGGNRGGGGKLKKLAMLAGGATGGTAGLVAARNLSKSKISRALVGQMHQIPYKLAASTKSHR